MSQDEKVGIEIVTAKIKIKIKKVINFSKNKVPPNAKENAGELLIKRNLEEMKKWSDDEISEIFDDQGNLKRRRKRSWKPSDPGSRVDLIRKTKTLAAAALKLIFEDEKLENSEFEIPSKNELKRMAKELISEENIRKKFKKSFIEYARVQRY